MSIASKNLPPSADALLADLTDAAYRVALRHGFKGSFIDVQLELWAELRRVLYGEAFADADADDPALQARKPRRNWEIAREGEPCQV